MAAFVVTGVVAGKGVERRGRVAMIGSAAIRTKATRPPSRGVVKRTSDIQCRQLLKMTNLLSFSEADCTNFP